MKIVTYEGTEIVLSPVELAELVELGLAEVDIDLTDTISIDEEEGDSELSIESLFNPCECESCNPEEYSYCEEEGIKARPSIIDRALDRTPEPVNRFEGKALAVVEEHGKITLTIDGWNIVSIDKEDGTLVRHICADLSGIESDEQGRIIMDEE
jgi:hypothetical protein